MAGLIRVQLEGETMNEVIWAEGLVKHYKEV